ncbi:MAG: polyprenyl synthetase family protein [Candidatus Latescibacterota bacterium]|nr:MAG: polyprenyl synthetase family protein [Candidatus Latescibacterota bacterium]
MSCPSTQPPRVAVPEATLLPGAREVVKQDLEAVEASLAAVCAEPGLRIGKAARHLLFSGGKRARPLLTCVILRALGRDPSPHVDVIAAVELAHTGSLLHDDIIDEARMRRGRRAAHLLFDIPTAILAGDLLLTAAIERTGRAGSRALRVRFSAALKDVCTGEALERERRFDPTVGVAHARRVNRLKTAALFAYAAEAGAILGGVERDVRSELRAYGMALGEAFQLTDDLLDLQGDADVLGKPNGMDLAAGCVTVPVAIALERDPKLRDVVLEVWRSSRNRASAVARLCRGMRRVEAFAATRELALECAERATTGIECLPAPLWRDQLEALARAVVRREH